ncbi:MAG: hypothetical protein BIFFINMI_02421 [Phycisphaerae bacterium]|nr:hypothetical protein [Phycisphaerae bacterium]
MPELSADIVVVGGGVGGCAAALAACRAGRTVIMTEPTAWIGGQLTQQAVPPDENRWIEEFGGTLSYRTYRTMVRQYYRDHYPLTPAARAKWNLNPGNGGVSRVCHEFRVGLAVLEAMLAPYRSSGRLRVLLYAEPTAATADGDRITSVTVRQSCPEAEWTLTAPYVIDATELGDLLPLAGVEYVSGAESKKMTGEPSAKDEYEPTNMQAITFTFAMDHLPGEDHTIDRPTQYGFWRDYVPQLRPAWSGKLLSWTQCHPHNCSPFHRKLFDKPSLWWFRNIVDRDNFVEGTFRSHITLVNWPQIDYWLGPICEVPADEVAKHLEGARQLSLSWLYWMQTEAPRDDGKGAGYPGLRLRGDVVGDTPDGLAMYPYIRECRRIQAEFTVLEQHVDRKCRGDRGAEPFADSVGIGYYRIDLHPTTGGDNYFDVDSCPFQIPLGSLIPRRVENLLAGAKNLGVTHITNGCYRLHPVEWNIGEAAGALAAHCLANRLTPRQVRNDPAKLEAFQKQLLAEGIRLQWPRIYTDANP